MAAQPQQQIQQAINAAEQALRLEPELADKATLKHAISLLQRVHSKNASETGQQQQPPPSSSKSYSQIINDTVKGL